MINSLLIGTCILLNGYQYKIFDFSSTTYTLSQEVIVFEQKRIFFDMYKISYINKEAKLCKEK